MLCIIWRFHWKHEVKGKIVSEALDMNEYFQTPHILDLQFYKCLCRWRIKQMKNFNKIKCSVMYFPLNSISLNQLMWNLIWIGFLSVGSANCQLSGNIRPWRAKRVEIIEWEIPIVKTILCLVNNLVINLFLIKVYFHHSRSSANNFSVL